MIYLILCAGFKNNNPDLFEKRLKIGYTSNLNKRMKSYSTTNPDYILLKTREGGLDLESYLHKRFEKYKYKDSREWFYYNQEIIDQFYCNIEDCVDESTLLYHIKKDLLSNLSHVFELNKKYIKQLLDNLKLSSNYTKSIYDKSRITLAVNTVWEKERNLLKDIINKAYLVNFKPIDLNSEVNYNNITVNINLGIPEVCGKFKLFDCPVPWLMKKVGINYNLICSKVLNDDFSSLIDHKMRITDEMLSNFETSTFKDSIINIYKKIGPYNFSDNYLQVINKKEKDIPIFNKLIMEAELSARRVLYDDFKNKLNFAIKN